jgi:probable HAF family extracellular repeat protein
MIRRSSLSPLAALLMSAATVAQTPSSPKYTIVDLGTLGGTMSLGSAINEAGQVTGSSFLAGDTWIHAFRWDGTTMTDLGTLDVGPSYGLAINSAGQVTGRSDIAGPTEQGHAFRSDGTTMIDLGTLGGTTSEGRAINAAGQVTGGAYLPGDTLVHAFRSDGTTMIDLGTLGGRHSQGWAINAAGQVTGFSFLAAGNIHAVRSDGTTMIDLGTLGGSRSEGFAINAAGQVAGYASLAGDTATHAFRSDGTTMIDLGTLGGGSSVGLAINASGQVAGYSSLAGDSVWHAFRWDGTTMIDLGTLGSHCMVTGINTAGQVTGWCWLAGDVERHPFVALPGRAMLDLNDLIPTGSGWVLEDATAVNDKGRITGSGRVNGQRHAFLLTPEPTMYPFRGFLPPVANLPAVNAVKAGAAVPVKFGLGGDHGLLVFASGYPRSQQMICHGDLTDDTQPTISKGANTLHYGAASGQYTYVWATDKAWAGTCRQLQLKFTDGQVQSAAFSFR